MLRLFASALAVATVVQSATLNKRSAPQPRFLTGDFLGLGKGGFPVHQKEDFNIFGKEGFNDPIDHRGEIHKGKIVNGNAVDEGIWPWVVRLEMTKTQPDGSAILYSCVGSLIAPETVVTAAHCFSNADGTERLYDSMWAYVGMNNVDISKNSNTVFSREITCVHMHQSWDGVNFLNDIAMVKLAQSVPVTPVNLTRSFDPYKDISASKKYFIAGWGGTKQQAPEDDIVEQDSTDILMFAETGLVGLAECQSVYGTTTITANNLCGDTSGEAQAVDTCVGDSGGPLFEIDSNGYATLVAITSWGAGCAAAGFPGVYTNAGKYHQWILNGFAATDLCETNLDLQNNGDWVGKTKGGCTCKYHWGINDTTCDDGDATYYHCGMVPPCDGDNQGSEMTTWCFYDLDVSDPNCAAAGRNWDYCTVGVGLCQDNEYASAGKCHVCPAGTNNVAGDNPAKKHTFTNQYINTRCLPNQCQDNEYVVDHQCVQCAQGLFYSGAVTDVQYTNGANPGESPCATKTCGAGEHVINFDCVPCPAGETNGAGDMTNVDSTTCFAEACKENEFVNNNVCTPCAVGATNAAGDMANGINSRCQSSQLTADDENCHPNTPSNPSWTVDNDYQLVGNHRMVNTKTHADAKWVFVQGDTSTAPAKSVDACAQECRKRGNDCKAFEFNTRHISRQCVVHGASVEFAGYPSVVSSAWTLYKKTTWCGAYETTTPEPVLLPDCPSNYTTRLSKKFLQKRLKKTNSFTIGARLENHDLEQCARACYEQQEPECKSIEWKQPTMNNKGTRMMPPKCELKITNTDEVPIKTNLEGWFNFKMIIRDCVDAAPQLRPL